MKRPSVALLILFGFLAASAWDLACRPSSADAAVVLDTAGVDWRVHFTRHSENVGVEIWQRCWVNSKLMWQNTALVHVESDWDEVVTRRTLEGIPRGAACIAIFQVIRNPEGSVGDPQKDYDAPSESAQISWVQQ